MKEKIKLILHDIVDVIGTLGFCALICFAFVGMCKQPVEEMNRVTITDTTYNHIILDSIEYNIKIKDSIIYNIQQEYEKDSSEIIVLDDTSTMYLFEQLVTE